MVVALPFNASLTSLQLPRVLQRSTALAASGRRLSHPSRAITSTELTSRSTMSSRRSARLSARLQAEPTRQDAPAQVMPAASPPATKARKRKVPTAEVEVPAEAPATPKRRAKNSAVPSLPSDPTATPSAVRLIAEPAATTVSTPKPKPRAVERLADPNLTNAPLLSPETSRVISYNPTDTANILEEACAHLIKGETFPRVTVCRWCLLCVVRAWTSFGVPPILVPHAPSGSVSLGDGHWEEGGRGQADPLQSDHDAARRSWQ